MSTSVSMFPVARHAIRVIRLKKADQKLLLATTMYVGMLYAYHVSMEYSENIVLPIKFSLFRTKHTWFTHFMIALNNNIKSLLIVHNIICLLLNWSSKGKKY